MKLEPVKPPPDQRDKNGAEADLPPDPFAREFQLDNGHRISVARAAIIFVQEGADGDAIIGLRNYKPVAVRVPYSEISKWWLTQAPKFREVRSARN
jgi:hypothetical protein